MLLAPASPPPPPQMLLCDFLTRLDAFCLGLAREEPLAEPLRRSQEALGLVPLRKEQGAMVGAGAGGWKGNLLDSHREAKPRAHFGITENREVRTDYAQATAKPSWRKCHVG